MKIVVLHGDDQEKLQKRLALFLKTASFRKLTITRLTWSDLVNHLRKKALFESSEFILISGLIGFTKKEVDYLNKDDEVNTTIVVYINSILTATQIAKFPKTTTFEAFAMPKLLYPLLDEIMPGKSKEVLLKMHELVKTQSIEGLFALISRRIRDLIWVTSSPSNITYPSWIVGKLESQAGKFTLKKLEGMLKDLLVIDIKQKTSKDTLLWMLDDFFIKRLQ